MSRRCVVYGCSSVAHKATGISVHTSPLKKADLNKWKRFVRAHRANFDPPGRFGVCSSHFDDKLFSRAVHIEGQQRRLQTGAIPTIWGIERKENEQTSSDRNRRGVSDRFENFCLCLFTLSVCTRFNIKLVF